MKKLIRVLVINYCFMISSAITTQYRSTFEFIKYLSPMSTNAYAQSTSFSTKDVLGQKAEFLEEEVKAGGNFITGTVRVIISVLMIFGGIVMLGFNPSAGVMLLGVGTLVAMYPKIAKGVFNSFGSTKGIFN